MYNELTRSMNQQERALLSELAAKTAPPAKLSETVKWVLAWTGGIVLCALVAILLVSLGMHPIILGIIGGPLAIAATICLYVIILLIDGHRQWLRNHRSFLRHELPEIHKALENGNVFVKRVSATAVIEIVEFDDEGAGYLYDVGDGKILFLKGQRFYPVNDDMPWPNAGFDIVRSLHGDMWVGIFCWGNELAPIRTLEASECLDDIAWDDREELLDGDIDSFAKSIMKAA